MQFKSFVLASLFFFASQASAVPMYFDFSGSDSGGTGSADMTVDVSGNTVTAVLNNVSPTTLDDGTGTNAPGIVGFGFDINPDTLVLSSYSLSAYDVNNNLVVDLFSSDWELNQGTNVNGITVDYAPWTDNGQIKGALYNPAATAGLAAAPNYFTEAVLTLTFDAAPTLDFADDFSPFVRLQNVGLNGEGSLKLPGTPGDPDEPPVGNPVPAPATLALMGLGLLGLVARRKKVQ